MTQTLTPNPETQTLVDTVIDTTIIMLYSCRPELRNLRGKAKDLMFVLQKYVLKEYGADAIVRVGDIAEAEHDNPSIEILLRTSLAAECTDMATRIAAAWDKYLELAEQTGTKIHTLARAFVYAHHAELSYQEQTPIILAALERMNAIWDKEIAPRAKVKASKA